MQSWQELIKNSFLSEENKSKLCALVGERAKQLNLIKLK